MAIKKRPTDEDDEEDEDRPRKKRSSRDDDEDDDDRPRKKTRARRDEEDEEERPRKKRKSREEAEEEEDEEDSKPAKGKKGKSKDDPDDPYEAWVRKQNVKRQQLLDGQEGLKGYRKRTALYLTSLMGYVVTGGIVGLLIFLAGKELGMYAGVLVAGDGLLFAFGIPALGIAAAKKSMLAPPKVEGNGILGVEIFVNCATMILALLAAALFFLAVFDFDKGQVDFDSGGGIAFAVLVAVFFVSYFFTFVIELSFFRAFASFLKNKELVQQTKATVVQFYSVYFGGTPVLAFAAYFLHFMGLVGYVLIGVFALVWLLLYLKGFTDMVSIIDKLGVSIGKKIAAMDKPDW